ncbi:MAG: lamin tail domain-containing protein [Acholeplasmataceae bacterium]|nr:lamin tail domain-containing protein [Acholeplasmataceae bacterium]
MKKLLLLLTVFLTLFSLMACGSKENTIIISKYYESTVFSDSAIELYNTTEKDVDLNKHTLDIYANGSTTVTYSIQLSGTIEAKSFFVVTADTVVNQTLSDASDFQSAELLFNGNDVITLTFNNNIVDIIGTIGSNADFGKDITLIRKASSLIPRTTYNGYDYIPYMPNVYQYLKSMEYPISTNEQMIDGPRLTDEFRELPFVDPEDENLGGGGAITVTLSHVSDGDTASFYGSHGGGSVRFYFIDTREVQGTGSPTGQPWGYPASAFTKKILEDARDDGKTIELQSIKGAALKDMYQRFLGLVWVDGELVNYMVVRAGLSDVNASDVSSNVTSMAYLNIPYYAYMQNAWQRASINQWGIHSAADPDWNYQTNSPILPIQNFPPARLYDPSIDE